MLCLPFANRTLRTCHPHTCAGREVVEKLVDNGDAAAAGRMCVAAIQMGPEQADVVRHIAVQLIVNGSAATAATLGAAFWQEAAAAGSDAGAAAPCPWSAAAAADPATPHKRAARSLAEAALSELTSGRAALQPGQPGSPTSPMSPPAAVAAPPAESTAAASAAEEIQPTAPEASPPPPAASPPPAAEAPAGPPQPTSRELQAAAAVVFAAASVEAVGLGHAATMVEVTQLLLDAGQQELVAALVATMVEAGEGVQRWGAPAAGIWGMVRPCGCA